MKLGSLRRWSATVGSVGSVGSVGAIGALGSVAALGAAFGFALQPAEANAANPQARIQVAAPAAGSSAPAVGDHWHIAWGVYVCDKYVKLPEATGNDPVGIHTHGDGLIHAHPFSEKAAGKNATMARFFETENIKVGNNTIKLGSTTYFGGKDCAGKKTKLSVFRWKNRSVKSPELVAGEASEIPLIDQQMVVFALVPDGANIAAPPSKAELADPADLPPPPLPTASLANLPAPPVPIPAAKLEGPAPAVLTLNDIVVGTGAEAKKGSLVYVRYTMSIWRTKAVIGKSTWSATEQPEALNRIGRGRLLPGLDKGLVGMKVGGIRQISMPPADGFGAGGNGEIKGTDTLVMVAQLVAIR
jgi:FKBP-type peptidyl-prolyl cis-trans isomerase